MTFHRILRTSAMLGVASVATLLAALLRSKIVALCLGATGIGTMGWLNQSIAMFTQIMGIGLPTVAVKKIAQAAPEQVLDYESAVAKLALQAGMAGLVVSLVLSAPLSLMSFGHYDQTLSMLVCSLAVPLGIISSAWSGVMQARGQNKILAYTQVIGAVIGAVALAASVSWKGLAGLPFGLVIAAICPLALTWRHRPKITGPIFVLDEKTKSLVRAGLALIGALALAQLAAYATRVIIVREFGIREAGYYQAAFAVSSMLPGFVFAAMSAEYYPRISAARTTEQVEKAINMQIQAGVLMGVPLLAGIFLFGDHLLVMLYTAEFKVAEGMLIWLTIAVAVRLVSWPIGYWLLGHARHVDYLLIEGFGALLVPLLALVVLPLTGLAGLGYVVCGVALIYNVTVIIYLKSKSGARLSSRTWLFVSAASLAMLFAIYLRTESIGTPASLIVLAMGGAAASIIYRRMARTPG